MYKFVFALFLSFVLIFTLQVWEWNMSVPQLQYKLFFAESGGIKAPLCPEKTPGSTLVHGES